MNTRTAASDGRCIDETAVALYQVASPSSLPATAAGASASIVRGEAGRE